MKPTMFVFAALIIAFMPARPVMADQAQDAQAAKATLQEKIAALKASQGPKHDAETAYTAAKTALDMNQTAIDKKKKEISDGQNQFDNNVKAATKAFNKAGGLINDPTFNERQSAALATWTATKKGLTAEQTQLENDRAQKLKPAADTAKAVRDAKRKAHDKAENETKDAAKAFLTANKCKKSGNLFTGLARGVAGEFSSLSDDCQEVRSAVHPGLCDGREFDKFLADIGIDAKSKVCGPTGGAAPIVGGIAGAGNGG